MNTYPTLNEFDLQRFKQRVITRECDEFTAVETAAYLLVNHYAPQLTGDLKPIFGRLMVKEAIRQMHGQCRRDLSNAALYAVELMEKAQKDELTLTYNAASRYSCLQFETPRVE
ncbi:hypothetical protein KW507_15670 [Vibrio fluvialis]|nr:hypothetical protein [Vibrio fluvialis]